MRCYVKNVFLKISQNSEEKHLCRTLLFDKFVGKGEILKNHFIEHFRVCECFCRLWREVVTDNFIIAFKFNNEF